MAGDRPVRAGTGGKFTFLPGRAPCYVQPSEMEIFGTHFIGRLERPKRQALNSLSVFFLQLTGHLFSAERRPCELFWRNEATHHTKRDLGHLAVSNHFFQP
jgi:hypothetical protein